MTRLRTLATRLLERRLFRDGDADASILPGSLTTLAMSTLVSSLVVGEIPLREIAVLIAIAVFAWSVLRGSLETAELEDEALDARVLLPLPIHAWEFVVARFAVVGVGVLVDSFNLSLPLAVMVGFREGIGDALVIVAIAVAATAFGLAAATWLKRFLGYLEEKTGIVDLGGPMRMATALAMFVGFVAAPELALSACLEAPWRFVPPISIAAAFADPRTFADAIAVVAAAGLAVALVASATRAPTGSSTRYVRRSRRLGMVSRFVERRIRDPIERAGFGLAGASIRNDRVFRTRTFPLMAFPFAAILLTGLEASDPTLVPMAFFGATIYLVLGETFFVYSESRTGPELLQTVPIANRRTFRLGGEKAYIAELVVPVHLALIFGAVAFDAAAGRFRDVVPHVCLGLLALLVSIAIVFVSFDKLPGLPFGAPDRALYPTDVSGGAYGALVLCTVAALVVTPTLSRPAVVVTEFVVLVVIVAGVVRWKRRAVTPGENPNAPT